MCVGDVRMYLCTFVVMCPSPAQLTYSEDSQHYPLAVMLETRGTRSMSLSLINIAVVVLHS